MVDFAENGEMIGPGEYFSLNEAHTQHHIAPTIELLEKMTDDSDALRLANELKTSLRKSALGEEMRTTELKLSTFQKVLGLSGEKYTQVKLGVMSGIKNEFAPHAHALTPIRELLDEGLDIITGKKEFDYHSIFSKPTFRRALSMLSNLNDRVSTLRFLANAETDITKTASDSVMALKVAGLSEQEIRGNILGGNRQYLADLPLHLQIHAKIVVAHQSIGGCVKDVVDAAKYADSVFSDDEKKQIFEKYANDNGLDLSGARVGVGKFLDEDF